MSENYVPTAKLRWIYTHEARKAAPRFDSRADDTMVLQQWWQPAYIAAYGRPLAGMPAGEWRDVPMETEHA